MKIKQKIFCVYDRAVEAYSTPFASDTPGAAMRMFLDLCNNPQHPYGQHPEDYVLYELGDWDQVTGDFEAHKEPVRTCYGNQDKIASPARGESEVAEPGADMFNGTHPVNTGAVNG